MKSFIKLGKFSLKLLYPIICLGVMILESIAQNNWYTKRRGNVVVSLFINSSSKLLNIFIYIPLKIFYFKTSLVEKVEDSEKVEDGEKAKKSRLKKNIIFFIILVIVEITYNIIYIVYYVKSRTESNVRKKEKGESLVYYAHSYGIFFLENLEIIFIFLATKFFLKYEYSLQCLISLILFTIFSIIIDIINYNNFIYKLGGFGIFMLIFVELLGESISIVFQKYMMETLFFNPLLAMCFYGLIDLIFTIILGSITYAKNGWYCYKENPRTCYLANFTDYFQDFGSSDVGSLIASYIFKYVTYILFIYTVYYLTPNHSLLVYIVGKFVENAIEAKTKIAENYIVFTLLLISFIFYLEVFELAFCGINKDSKKNIENRALDEAVDNNKLMNQLERRNDDNEDDINTSMSFDTGSNPNSPKNNDIGGYKF